jgi:hypothetical protein
MTSYLDKTLSKINYANRDVVILGDFNVDFNHSRLGQRNTMERKMHNFMCSLDFTQLIKAGADLGVVKPVTRLT